MTHRDKALLTGRVIRVVQRGGEGVVKHRQGLSERDAMFPVIQLSLSAIPFKVHSPVPLPEYIRYPSCAKPSLSPSNRNNRFRSVSAIPITGTTGAFTSDEPR